MKEKYIFYFLICLSICDFYKCELLKNNIDIIDNEVVDSYYSNLMFEEGDIIELKEDMDKKEYTIDSTSNFTNANEDFIYIFESYSTNCLIIKSDETGSDTLKNINILKFGEKITFSSCNEQNKIYISSIPNSNIYINTLNKDSYDQLFRKQKFTNIKILETNKALIATFGSFEDNNDVYYTKYNQDTMKPKDIYPINKDKFTKIDLENNIINLEENSVYIIINDVKEFYLTSFEFFIYPKETQNEITLEGKKENLLYINSGKTITINFNKSNKRIFKLSRKTLNSKITINGDKILSRDNLYSDIIDGSNSLNLKVENEDALIEFLYYSENEKIFDDIQNENLLISELGNRVEILVKLDFLEDYVFKLETESNKSFGTSICAKIGKDNYHYSADECKNTLTYGFSYEETIKKENLININHYGEEYFMVYINIYKTDINQVISLSYYPINLNETTINITGNDILKFIKKNETYRINIVNEKTYIFNFINYDKIMSYYPLFVFNDRTVNNEKELIIENGSKDKRLPLFINYYKNYTFSDNDELKIEIKKNTEKENKTALTVIIIVASILIAICIIIIIYALIKIKKNGKEKEDSGDVELIQS